MDKGIASVNTINFRDYANNKHATVDDYPYGGGGGMVLKPEPIFLAVEDVLSQQRAACGRRPRIILMCPQGEPFTQRKAEELRREGI